MKRADPLRVLACQVRVPPTPDRDARDRHLARLDGLLRTKLREMSADIVVLPELSSIDYSVEAFDSLATLAEALDGPSHEVFSKIARDARTPVFYGIPRREGRHNFITQVAVGADGRYLGHFDKLHMAHYGASVEKSYFCRGESLLILDVAGIRVAPLICYDIRFPELARALVLRHGAQLLLHCGAYYRDESYYSWHPFVMTRALENQVHVLSLNRAGENFGCSIFCPPWVDENHPQTVFPETEVCRIVEVDLAESQVARKRYTFLEDRLGDAAEYDALRTDMKCL